MGKRLILGLFLLAYLVCFKSILSAQDMRGWGYRIVNGTPAEISDYPWQVALSISSPDGTFLCGGSIIAPTWLLTAAHCFGSSPRSATVRAKAGVANYRTSGIWLDGERVFVHNRYNAQTQENDIALVRLPGPAPGIKIDLADAATMVPANATLEVTGWGVTAEGGESSDTLMVAKVPYVENATCNAATAYNGTVKDGMICAGYPGGGTDACQGDSGGPLIWRRPNSSPVLVGVVSFGEGCARKNKYGIYTRVSAFRDWIDRTMAAGQR
jgi:trypsin